MAQKHGCAHAEEFVVLQLDAEVGQKVRSVPMLEQKEGHRAGTVSI